MMICCAEALAPIVMPATATNPATSAGRARILIIVPPHLLLAGRVVPTSTRGPVGPCGGGDHYWRSSARLQIFGLAGNGKHGASRPDAADRRSRENAVNRIACARGAAVGLALALLPLAGEAKDLVRLVDSQPTVFDHFALYQAKAEGYFDAENIEVEVTVGRGGSAALQIVATGSADVVYGAGLLSVVGAYAKGAPVTILSNARLGAGDAFWYVKKDSPIRTCKDIDGKQFTYSAPGSFSNLLAESLIKEFAIKPKLVQTGNMASARTMMMSGQTDTAWTGFPANMDVIRSGEARVVCSGEDSKVLHGLSSRGITANSDWLAKNRDVAVRLMRALWKGQLYNFSGEKALRRYAEHWLLDFEDVKDVGKYFTLEDVRFGKLGKQAELLKLAVEYNFIKEPLTPA
jgi:NitT/TauT family transport system substrate-binding protein